MKKIEPIHDGSNPAFPQAMEIWDYYKREFPGVSVRDYFAAKALAPIVAASFTEIGAKAMFNLADKKNLTPEETAAQMAYSYADAMVKVGEVKK